MEGLWDSGMSDGAVLPENGEGGQQCACRLGGVHSQVSVGHWEASRELVWSVGRVWSADADLLVTNLEPCSAMPGAGGGECWGRGHCLSSLRSQCDPTDQCVGCSLSEDTARVLGEEYITWVERMEELVEVLFYMEMWEHVLHRLSSSHFAVSSLYPPALCTPPRQSCTVLPD